MSPGDALFDITPRPPPVVHRAGAALDLSVLPWFRARGVVTSNVRPLADDRHADHRIVLSSMGVTCSTASCSTSWRNGGAIESLNSYWWSRAARAGSTSSPVNPLAMF